MQKRSKVFDMSGGTLNQMPWLRFFAPEKTGYNLIRNLNKEFSQFFLEIINEHHQQYSDEKSGEDLIYAFIKEMKIQKGNLESTFTDIQLTMIILEIEHPVTCVPVPALPLSIHYSREYTANRSPNETSWATRVTRQHGRQPASALRWRAHQPN